MPRSKKIKLENTALASFLNKPIRIFKKTCFGIGLFVLLSICGFTIYAICFTYALPRVDKMSFEDLQGAARRSIHAKLEDKKVKHRWVPIADISRDVVYSIVLSEDSTFFEHEGINFDAIVDSLAENIRRKEHAYGASTISQQVVKNLFLTNEKSLIRKAKEYFITRRLERRFSKNEILEVYLNIAEFGPDIFGILGATSQFFHKHPRETNAAEGAFLALMLPSPRRNHYAVFQNENITKQKRRKIQRILRDMLYEELITEKQYNYYVNYPFFKPSREITRVPKRGKK